MAKRKADSLTKIGKKDGLELFMGHVGALALAIVLTALFFPIATDLIDWLYDLNVGAMAAYAVIHSVTTYCVVLLSLAGPDIMTVLKRAGIVSSLMPVIVPSLSFFSINSFIISLNTSDPLSAVVVSSSIMLVVSYRMTSTLVKNYLKTDETRQIVMMEKSQKLRMGRLYDMASVVLPGIRVSTILAMPLGILIIPSMVMIGAATGDGLIYSMCYIFAPMFMVWVMSVFARVWDISRRRDKFKPELYREESKLIVGHVDKKEDDIMIESR